MFEDDVVAHVLEMLADGMASRPTPPPNPLAVDTYLARSVMQKAIRRGLADLALRAAAQLLKTDPRAMWRRLLITSLEDLGPSEAGTTARIAFTHRDRRWREQHGGDWHVAAELVMQACERTRCQSANDLWNVAKHDPALEEFKTSLCDASLADLLSIMVDPVREVGERGAAVLIAIGEDAGPTAPVHIKPDSGAVFAAFTATGKVGPLVVGYQEAYRQNRLALAPLSLCFWPESAFTDEDGLDDELPPATWAGEMPTYAWDQYTARGKHAVRQFTQRNAAWRSFAERWSIPAADHVAAAGELLFRAEGARVTNRRQWNAGLDLYARSHPLGCFMSREAVADGLALILRQLPTIDRLRSRSPTTS